MLYENKTTGEFGITHSMLKAKFPNISFSEGILALEGYTAYKRSSIPSVTESQYFVEKAPVDGVQVFEVINKEETSEYLNDLRQSIKDKITAKRWAVESGGLTFPNGIKVKTAKEDQDRILSVIINAERYGIDLIDFKADSGWVTISLVALKQLANQLTRFVQNCFSKEKYHHGYIDSLTTANAILSYDYSLGWDLTYPDNTASLDTYGINIEELLIMLYSNFIFCSNLEGILKVNPEVKEVAQSLIDHLKYNVKDLNPTQFYYMLAKSGLYDAMEVLLPVLKTENLTKYAEYKAYLNGARYYSFAKAYSVYLDIKPKLLVVDNSLDYTQSDLITKWNEASTI